MFEIITMALNPKTRQQRSGLFSSKSFAMKMILKWYPTFNICANSKPIMPRRTLLLSPQWGKWMLGSHCCELRANREHSKLLKIYSSHLFTRKAAWFTFLSEITNFRVPLSWVGCSEAPSPRQSITQQASIRAPLTELWKLKWKSQFLWN